MKHPHSTRNKNSPEHRNSIKEIHLNIEKSNRQKKISKLKSKLALDLTGNVKHQIGNFMKRPQKTKTRLDNELFGDMLATDSKSKMQLLTNLESTRDDKKLTRDEDGDIIDVLGDTRGISLQHSFDKKPHGITDVINKQQTEHDRSRLLFDRKTPDGGKPPMTRTRADSLLDDIGKGKARKTKPIPTTQLFKLSKLKQRLAGFGLPPQRILDAFKAKQPAATKAFVSDGKKLLYNGNEVARHTRNGIEVSYAGFNSNTTAATIRGLGIDTRIVKGVTTINGIKVDPDSTDFTLVPNKNITKDKFRVRPQQRKEISKANRVKIDEAERFRRNMRIDATGRPNEVPEDPTQIQPRDQKYINHITGVKSPIGNKVRGVDAHHILSKEKFPGLRTNRTNAIPLSKPIHKELHKLNAKLTRFKSSLHVSKGMTKVAKNQSADSIINAFKKFASGTEIGQISGVFDPVENRILDARIPVDALRLQRFFESGANKIGLNSITDTRQGKATDIELIRSQLKEVEQGGGIPALGFDEGSFEALDVQVITTDKEILSALREHQRSTGILDADLTFRIVDNEKFRTN